MRKSDDRDRSKAADRSHTWWSNNGRIHNQRDGGQDHNEGYANFFFTNFPGMWNADHFRKLFRKFGTTTSVYIAKKKNKEGNRFGFVKFIKVADPSALESVLNGLPVGQSKLIVNIARYDRKTEDSKHPKIPVIRTKPTTRFSDARISPGKSFVDAINGISTVLPSTPQVTMIPPNDSTKWLKCCLIGTTSSYDELANVASLRNADGCDEITFRYLGGLDVLLEFESELLASDFLANAKDTWSGWFIKLCVWHPAYTPSGRMASILIGGLPPQVWSPSAFQLVAEIFGTVIRMDDSSEIGPNLSFARVGILSNSMTPISTTINVLINELVFQVAISEDQSESIRMAPRFTPYFYDDNNLEDGDENSSLERSDDEEDPPQERPQTVAGAVDASEDVQVASDPVVVGSMDNPKPNLEAHSDLPQYSIPGPYKSPSSDSIDLNRPMLSSDRFNTSQSLDNRPNPSLSRRPPRPLNQNATNWIASSSNSSGSVKTNEFRKTMELGSDIGFQMDGYEDVVNSALPISGDYFKSS